jgi:hypothetical protein
MASERRALLRRHIAIETALALAEQLESTAELPAELRYNIS